MDNTLDHTFESANRVYDKEQLCPTIPTCAGGNIQPKVIEETKVIGGLGEKMSNKGTQYFQQDRVYKGDIAMAQPAQLPGGSYNYLLEEEKTIEKDCIHVKQATKKGYIECPVGDCFDASYPNSALRRGRVQDHGNVTPTLTAGSSENIKYVETRYRIRKLTPRECWRLMNFTDSDFDKARYKKETLYIQGGNEVCNAKLKIVAEKQRLINTETYVSCIINDMRDMETLKIIKKLSVETQESGKMQNVSFAITKSGEMAHTAYAINTIKCFAFMGMQCTLTEDKDRHHTVIIVQEKKDKGNIARSMKITTESNLDQSKLYTILILIELIMKSGIYGSTTLKANIQGNIAITDVCENNILLKVSNLKMENTSTRVSSSQLYKQAGNSIVVSVLSAIFSQLNIKGVKPWNERTDAERREVIHGY